MDRMQKAARWLGVAALVALAACLGMDDDQGTAEQPGEELGATSTPLVGAVTRSFQNGVAPSTTYAGTRDTFLAQDIPTTNQGGATVRVDGDSTSGMDYATLISWDVSSIPAGSVVRQVTLTVNVSNPSGGDYQLYDIKRSWSESQATWNNATWNTACGSAGAKATTDRGTTVLGTISARATGFSTVTLNASGIAVVQGWVNTPSTNLGFAIANTSTSDGLVFASREATTASQRPRLSIGYDAPGTTTTTTTAIPTDANLKVAIIGDTAAGPNFKSVLRLVKSEGADLVMIQGDLTYSGTTPAAWFSAVDNEINQAWPGSTAAVTIPYFVAKGNHDADWGTLGGGLRDRMAKWGVASENNDPSARNYSVVHRGLKMVMVDDTETTPTRADYVNQRLAGDTHVWKMCSWHKDQRATNVGPKSDEMGWQIYENCRLQGAIVAQGHSHTYSRSKTITNDAAQTVDPTCSDPFNLCVSRGRHIFLDSSLGGVDTRTLDATWSTKPYWGSVYSASFGALFLELNVDGDPRKARGYFKTVGGAVIDPPASSGLTSFVIRRTD
jgi:predicted phosphodiesterase